MRPRLSCCWGITIVAGLAWFTSANNSAHAQYSYGYDSLAYEPTAQTYWYNSGYQSVYTDPSTGSYVNGTAVPNRTAAPYAAPPYGMFPRGGVLPDVPARATLMLRPSAVSAEVEPPSQQKVIRPRRGLFGRRR